MTDFLRSMADTDGFMPHGMCYLWEPELLWLHFTADLLTGLAYWAIPPALIFLVVKARKEVPDDASYGPQRMPYDWMFVAFGIFIVACGATHFMEVWTIWDPRYWLSGGIKAVTAAASVATAVALPPLIPRALNLIRDARDSELRRRRLEAANLELEELSGRLREANRLKTELVANVSHELRTPLTLILGPVDELEERDDLPDDVRAALGTIRTNARSLVGQVDDLLDVARMDLGALELDVEEADLAALVRETARHFRPLARRKDVVLDVAAPERLPFRVDAEKVERVLLNLLSNAVKFTPEGGRIRCTLAAEGEEGGREAGGARVVVLEVRDSGPGVPAEMREEVFRRFRQAEGGSRRSHRGVGLGLAITRELVELHGGVVAVDDAPEGGARFRVRIPEQGDGAPAGADAAELPEPSAAASVRARLEAAAEPTAPAPAAPVREGPPEGHVLLVEDDPALRDFLTRVLGRRYRVDTASDGFEALERLEEGLPDLILTDVMMPRMDGEELLSRIRSRPDWRDVPVVALTARADPDLAARLLRAGARDYVQKPVSVEELRARTGAHMEQVRSRRILQRELASSEDRLEWLAEEAAERKRRLEETVEEKELLVRELHHRVKGNLQTVSSLLNLQRRRTRDDAARRILMESRGRIDAMAVLHEKLYQTDDPTRTRMDRYLKSLARDVSQSWQAGEGAGHIATELEVEPLVVDADRAVTVGLLVHELLSNAFRHAYPEGGGGTVRVELSSSDDGDEVRITVADDGVGLPEGMDPRATDSLGLGLVASLIGQLEGTLEYSTDEGTEWRISFPLAAPPERDRRNQT